MKLLTKSLPDGRTKLRFVRHGEHEGGEDVCQGPEQDATGLTARGVLQCHALADRLQDESFSCIYTGTLRRHQETLDLLGNKDGRIPTVSDPALNERANGTWAGRSKRELGEKGLLQPWRDGGLRPSGGESGYDVFARVAAFIEDRMLNWYGKSVIIVTSGTPIRSAFAHLMGIPFQAMQYMTVTNTSLCIFKQRGHGAHWELECWNDAGHLWKAGITASELLATPTR